jgi:hypothetical protein
MPKPSYLQILARLLSLANDDSPLLTMRERNDVLGWANNDKRSWRRGTFKKIKRLWALVQERGR